MITNHQLVGAHAAPSPNHSGIIDPKFIVMHYTASWEVDSVLRTFASRSSQVSAHITVDTDGTIYQHVPFNVKAWHAGPSAYAGYSGLNSHAIGIEIVNPGFCYKINGELYDAHKRPVPKDFKGSYIPERNARVGGGIYYWPEYTDAQLDAVESVTRQLIPAYKILDIVSHEEIDLRGWKTDPGPAFPMWRFKALVNNRKRDEDRYMVIANELNVRGGPGTEFKVLSKVARGDIVPAKDKRGSWVRVSADGWVHGAYLRLV